MRILLVEDNPVDAEEFRRAVLKYRPSLTVLHFRSLERALKELTDDDCLVVDLHGTSSGSPADVIERLSQVPQAPRIVYTGSVDWETAYQCGIRRLGYIPKSKDASHMLPLIGHAIGQFEAYQEFDRQVEEVEKTYFPPGGAACV